MFNGSEGPGHVLSGNTMGKMYFILYDQSNCYYLFTLAKQKQRDFK